MKYKIVLFDKDGTLLRFESVWVEIGHQIIESFMKEYDITEPKETFLSLLGLGDNNINPVGILSSGTTNDIIKVFKQFSDDDSVASWTRTKMDELAARYEEQLEMIEGTDDILKILKDKGYILSLVTADDYMSTDNFLRKFNIRQYFDDIITSDRTPVQKPDAIILDEIFEKYDVQPEEIIMVGDTPIDMALGKNAKLGVLVGVLSGTSLHEHLKDADYIINDITEIVTNEEILWEGGTVNA